MKALGRRLRELRGFELTQEEFSERARGKPEPALEVRERSRGSFRRGSFLREETLWGQ
jgi:hypothetical protein